MLHSAGKASEGQTLELNGPINFLCNLKMVVISWRVTLQYAGKTCEGQTFYLICPLIFFVT
jgi:hypothetical protein